MSANYQAIYDAVRSRISNGNVGEVIRDVAQSSFDIRHQVASVAQEFAVAAAEMTRPSVLYRPRVMIDGNMWCALYGDNLQDGVAGFGESPAIAMHNFDLAWVAHLPPRPTKTKATP